MNLRRILETIRKSLFENLRDYKILIFVLAFAPAFMFILNAMYSENEATYHLAIVRNVEDKASVKLVTELGKSRYDSGKSRYSIVCYDSDGPEARQGIQKRQYDAIMVLGKDGKLDDEIERLKKNPTNAPVDIKLIGDTQNQRYSLVAIYVLTDLEDFLGAEAGVKPAYQLTEEFVGAGNELTEFDMFVPGMIAFALLNVMFTAGASFLKEAEKLTLHRLLISRLTTAEFVFSTLVVQGILCVLAMLLALGAAQLNGFGFSGSYGLLVIISLISTFAVVGVALLTVSFLKSVYDLMTIGIIPYFIVMFFSGIFFQLSSPSLFSVGGLLLRVNDLLPLTLSVKAFNQVLNFGADMKMVAPELIGTTIISLIYFGLGLWLFGQKHMKLRTGK